MLTIDRSTRARASAPGSGSGCDPVRRGRPWTSRSPHRDHAADPSADLSRNDCGIMGKPHKRPTGSTDNPHVKATSQPVTAVGDLVARVVESAGLGRTSQQTLIAEAWRGAVGREIAAQTEIQGLRGGMLTVLVGSAALA